MAKNQSGREKIETLNYRVVHCLSNFVNNYSFNNCSIKDALSRIKSDLASRGIDPNQAVIKAVALKNGR